jgi:hypothetical protein
LRNTVGELVERGYFGSLRQATMLLPTAVLFLKVLTMPREMVRIFGINYSAWKERVKDQRWPWTTNLPHSDSSLDLEYDGQRAKPSTEKYLRPTWGVDPSAPEILALAQQLGAGQASKRDFADSAFKFVKNRIFWSMDWPMGGAVGTLKAGYGTCLHKMSLLVALLRANKIPARYRMLGVRMVRQLYDLSVGVDPLGSKVYDSIGFIYGHGCVEMLLDGEWVPADVTWDENLEVGLDLPLSKLGMDPEGVWYFAVPGMALRMEGLPIFLDFFGPMLPAMYRGMFDILNERFEKTRKTGRERLQEIGRDRYIEERKNLYVPRPPMIAAE